ncbi:MAG TPA: response regulator, partial [Cryomorphaceae bacterium]|nr:response regulator [Cryomorphaceae bacterium]
LILLDINLPIYSGHEVLQEIKEALDLKKIPIIMLTTSSSQSDIAKAYEHHCNSYVNKPLEVEEFMQAILKIEAFWLQLTSLSE